jgi:hypothetical protein
MTTLLAEIMADNIVIGLALLEVADRSMGVAGGTFRPNCNYDPARHAYQLDEVSLIDSPSRIPVVARDPNGALIECSGVGIVDCASDLGDDGREVEVLGIVEFQRYFGR